MWNVRAPASTHTSEGLCRVETLRALLRRGVIQKLSNNLLSRTLRVLDNTLLMASRVLFGAKRLTTSGGSRQALRQTRLPPALLLIRNALGVETIEGD